jgi:hypothetical protein
MFFIPLTIYMLLCLLVAYRGRQTELGYMGAFLLSVFLTPVLVFIGLLLLTPTPGVVTQVHREDGRTSSSR